MRVQAGTAHFVRGCWLQRRVLIRLLLLPRDDVLTLHNLVVNAEWVVVVEVVHVAGIAAARLQLHLAFGLAWQMGRCSVRVILWLLVDERLFDGGYCLAASMRWLLTRRQLRELRWSLGRLLAADAPPAATDRQLAVLIQVLLSAVLPLNLLVDMLPISRRDSSHVVHRLVRRALGLRLEEGAGLRVLGDGVD